MSLEAIREVDEAQKKAAALLSEMTAGARALVTEAEAEGKTLLSDIRKIAADDYARAMSEAEKESQVKMQAVLTEAEQKADNLKQKAENKISDAVSIITGRVVNG